MKSQTPCALKPTTADDLPILLRLWNDGRVMAAVGYPGGLGYDFAQMEAWYSRLLSNPLRKHFMLLDGEGLPSGELYWQVDPLHARAGLDVKLFPEAQGRGLAQAGLSALIDRCFSELPEVAELWTEPSSRNAAARRLYSRCGLVPRTRPSDLGEGDSYWAMSRVEWAGLRAKEDAGQECEGGSIAYRVLEAREAGLLFGIDRSEVIDRVYHLRDGRLVLLDEHYDMKGFSPGALEQIVERQAALVEAGGVLLGAFEAGRIVGAVSVERKARGREGEYRKLDILFVSMPWRGRGIARRLVAEARVIAASFGASKLYISATPSEHTVGFYSSLGAVAVSRVDPELFALEPEDIHLELAVDDGRS